jgi:hypothetical protein
MLSRVSSRIPPRSPILYEHTNNTSFQIPAHQTESLDPQFSHQEEISTNIHQQQQQQQQLSIDDNQQDKSSYVQLTPDQWEKLNEAIAAVRQFDTTMNEPKRQKIA